jgi:GNAT superfamily N-acetyltransferase
MPEIGHSRLNADYTIVEQLPSAAEYNRLRTLVGWEPYQEDVIDRSLPHSLYCVCALQGEQMVGMARIIGDAGMVYYIQDVIVTPAHQRRGIGTRMMDMVMAYVRAHASHNSIVGLMAAKGKEPFYLHYGFTRRPTDTFGAGMTLFWQETPGETG